MAATGRHRYSVAVVRTALVGWLCLALVPPTSDREADANTVAGAADDDEPASQVGVLSEGGRRRGGVELTLGGVAVAVAGALIAFGAMELRSGRARERSCARAYQDICTVDPPSFSYAAGGLGLGLAVPVLIGAAFLWARGAKIHRDARAVGALQRASLSVAIGRGVSAVTVGASVRF